MNKDDKKAIKITYDYYDRCIACGAYVPEGWMVCPNCETQSPLEIINNKTNGKNK